jgi:biotin-dependent carboxylase-like uncharacterized protein
MRALLVTSPGPRTTVEDAGRRMVARFGIPAGGAFDALALAAANRLVGNADDAAGLEMTLGGPTLDNHGDEQLHIALAGADCAASVVQGTARRPVPVGAAFPMLPGETLKLGFARDGARAWLAVAGGIAVAPRLGSRATCLVGRFGGLDGRALHRHDVLPIGRVQGPPLATTWLDEVAAAGSPHVLRIVPGPQVACFGEDARLLLASLDWRVQNDSDRTGIRLDTADAASRAPMGGVAGIAPEGTTLGAIQLPKDGRPIILGPDRPVTGGYAKPALVIAADVGRLARLRPGDAVRFAWISLDDAIALGRQRRAALPGACG